jgi:hypothetical protein
MKRPARFGRISHASERIRRRIGLSWRLIHARSPALSGSIKAWAFSSHNITWS